MIRECRIHYLVLSPRILLLPSEFYIVLLFPLSITGRMGSIAPCLTARHILKLGARFRLYLAWDWVEARVSMVGSIRVASPASSMPGTRPEGRAGTIRI